MNVFAKIFSQIFDSSISSDYIVRHTFMDLLVLADREGVVDMTPDAIARRTNVPEEMIIHAINILTSPDPRSRSSEAEGRRLLPIDSRRDWGWQIVNYEHYRNLRDEEARRAYFRDKKREQRSKTITPVPEVSALVQDSPTVSTKGDIEAEEEKEQKHSRAKSARGKKTEAAKSRHAEFKAAILAYWKSKNDGVEMPWGPAEGRNLEMWLRETPNTTIEQFTGYLRNRYRSEVNHTERPSRWIGNVTSFAAGPIDKYGKLRGEEIISAEARIGRYDGPSNEMTDEQLRELEYKRSFGAVKAYIHERTADVSLKSIQRIFHYSYARAVEIFDALVAEGTLSRPCAENGMKWVINNPDWRDGDD
jgi:hypothetical protein